MGQKSKKIWGYSEIIQIIYGPKIGKPVHNISRNCQKISRQSKNIQKISQKPEGRAKLTTGKIWLRRF